MNALLGLISDLLSVYLMIIFARVVLSWLVVFNVVSPHQPIVASIGRGLERLTEPAFRPVRDFLARIGFGNIGGIDLAPLIVALLLIFGQRLINQDLLPLLT